jgi:type III pantothenate kinase
LRDTHRFPLAIEMDAPEQVGDDRLANALAAHYRADGPALVADLGTAVTIDVITVRGYAGGVIAPGMRLAARALHEATALLPLVDVDAPDRVMGKSTVAACQSGLTYGIAAMVDGLADRLRTEQEMPDAPLLVTGGHALLLARLMRLATDVQPDLTLEGLRLWSEANG